MAPAPRCRGAPTEKCRSAKCGGFRCQTSAPSSDSFQTKVFHLQPNAPIQCSPFGRSSFWVNLNPGGLKLPPPNAVCAARRGPGAAAGTAAAAAGRAGALVPRATFQGGHGAAASHASCPASKRGRGQSPEGLWGRWHRGAAVPGWCRRL